MLLGIGVGAVIPTVSSRAIEAAGIERASLVSGLCLCVSFLVRPSYWP